MSIPSISIDSVAEAVAIKYGLKGELNILGSCQDANFRLVITTGKEYVVKISNSATTHNEIAFQNKMLAYLTRPESACREFHFPQIILQLDGVTEIGSVMCNGIIHFIRVLTFVKGIVLSEVKYFSPDVLKSFGECVAKMSIALSSLEQELDGTGLSAPEFLQWDLQHATRVITDLLPNVEDVSKREKLSFVTKLAFDVIEPRKTHFRKQIVHGDLAHYNLVGAIGPNGRPFISGVIDFGDAMKSWVVGDLAVCITSGFEYEGWKSSALLQAAEVLKGFLLVSTLNEEEIDSLWPLIMIRCVVNIVSINKELLLEPDNPYNIKGIEKEWILYERVASFPMSLAIETFRKVAGFPTSSRFRISRIIPSIRADAQAGVGADSPPPPEQGPGLHIRLADTSVCEISVGGRELDLGVTSPAFTSGSWLDVTKVKACIINESEKWASLSSSSSSSSASSIAVASAPYGLAQLFRTQLRSMCEPATIPLGVGFSLPAQSALLAPYDCTAYQLIDEGNVVLVLCCPLFDILVRGLNEKFLADPRLRADAIPLKAGDQCGRVNEEDSTSVFSSYINIQVCLARWDEIRSQSCSINNSEELKIPQYATASMFPYWSVICPSPFSIFGIETASSVSLAITSSLQSRKAFVAKVQEHYYDTPPNIERAFGVFMYDNNEGLRALMSILSQ